MSFDSGSVQTQLTVAHVLFRTTRSCVGGQMGGGFRRETRSVSFVLLRLLRNIESSCEHVLDRDQDFRATGQRHAFVGKYRAAAAGRTTSFRC